MPRFRSSPSSVLSTPLTSDRLRALLAEMIRPAHFFLVPQLDLQWEHDAAEELVWEIFRGQLLDPAHTRQRRTFEAWKVYAASPGENRSGEPLLALYLDAEMHHLHVVRGLDCYAWEGYDAGGNVYLSRERRKWLRELVATIRLDSFSETTALADELACQLFQAVVGTSRLPLSSVETPLPSFSFGQLFYCYRADAPSSAEAVRGWRGLTADMLAPGLNPREEAHLLETFLHAVPLEEMGEAVTTFVGRWSECGRNETALPLLLRSLFNEVSLSPYTDLVVKTLAFLHALEEKALFTIEQVADFLGYLLRHLGRHLTAYDLVVFHHRGANYPDALLLDAVLAEYRTLLERRADLFLDAAGDDDKTRRRKRIRRRALRQGWLLRRRYEGHAVPDLPTSPGENQRVLPPSHPRVPEEQITQPARRVRLLYDGDPLVSSASTRIRELLRQSFVDLEQAEEWREMGLGVFLDRPFGVGKAVGAPDGTLLLSAEAFSVSLARQRLHALAADAGVSRNEELFQRLLASPPVHGLALESLGDAVRPGTVTLLDARRAASDFVFLRSTSSSVKTFFVSFDFTPLFARFHLDDLMQDGNVLLARSPTSDGLILYDGQRRPRLELEVAAEKGFANRGGQEYPLGGLRVLRVGETTDDASLRMHDLREQPLSLVGIDGAIAAVKSWK
jgi:hypothetical protein